MLSIDLTGKRAVVCGVADDQGFGFAIAKALAEAGATVCAATWPPAYNIFTTILTRGKIDAARTLSSGKLLEFEKIYPFDAAYDTMADVPEDVRTSKRYADRGDYTDRGIGEGAGGRFRREAARLHRPLARQRLRGEEAAARDVSPGYLGAVGVSAYSMVSLVSRPGAARSQRRRVRLAHVHGERARDPRYGGGMSSAKAALESDTRVLAFEAGRKWGIRVNTISAGPVGIARGERHRDHRRHGRVREAELAAAGGASTADEVGHAAAFLLSPLASGITGSVVYVDKGYHAMGKAV